MEQLLDYGMQIAATLLITLIGVLGTWLTVKLGKNTNLQNINAAQKEVIRAAKITVGELQQTLVGELKAASADGKLKADEVEALKQKLVEKTLEKLSAPAYTLLQSAAVDIQALITGAGESWIDQIKTQSAA
ncbi:MAG TPA: hypothetical protein VN453_04400 [Feifaniaceae bacterium]|nr:hypothetical protein [Feifaniaceae bacterium]